MAEVKATVVALNTRSKAAGWIGRAKRLGAVVNATDPSFVGVCETYLSRRPLLTRAMPQLTLAVAHRGKGLYYHPDRWVLTPGTTRKYSLGHGKHAVAARFTHLRSGKPLVVVSLHLLVGKDKRPERRSELNRLLTLVLIDYNDAEPVALVGDYNDTELQDVYNLPRFGYKDLRYRLPRSRQINAGYDTFHGYRSPAPQRGKQIDRVLGRRLGADVYRVLVHGNPRGSDHWPVLVRVIIP